MSNIRNVFLGNEINHEFYMSNFVKRNGLDPKKVLFSAIYNHSKSRERIKMRVVRNRNLDSFFIKFLF